MIRMTKRMKITKRVRMKVLVLIGQVMMMDTLTMKRLLLLLSIFSSSFVSLFSVLSRSRGQELDYSGSEEDNITMERRFERRFKLDDEVEIMGSN